MELVKKELDALREQRISIPPIFTRGVGIKRALGSLEEPRIGPTELELVLWLPVDDQPSWDDIDELLGRRGELTTRRIPREVLAALGIGDSLELDASGGVVGHAYGPTTAFGNVFWKPNHALATQRGLLVSLTKG